jgi:hypothetical protein
VAGRVVMAAVVRFQGGGRLRRGGDEEAAPIAGGERRRRPRDIRSHAEEVVGGSWRRAAGRAATLGCREPEVEDEAGEPDGAGLGRAGRVATRLKGLFGLKNERKRKMGYRTFFQFFKQRFAFKN